MSQIPALAGGRRNFRRNRAAPPLNRYETRRTAVRCNPKEGNEDMNRTFLIPALAALALTGATALEAREGHGPMRDMSFADIDGDGDGQITRDEMQAMARSRFATADADGDGKLTAAEIEAHAAKRAAERAARMVERFDTDGDGAVSFDEMPHREARAGRGFDRMDADDNGTISQDEFDTAKARMAERMQRHGMRHGKSGDDN